MYFILMYVETFAYRLFLELRMKVAGLCGNLYAKVSTYMRMKYINKEAVL
jgi:hypothetical protein